MLKIYSLVFGGAYCNCYIVCDSERNDAIVIDPGANFQKIDAKLCEHSLTPKHIFLTHAHYDHIGAVDALCDKYGCDIFVGKNDLPLLSSPELNFSAHHDRQITVKNDNITAVCDEKKTLCGIDFLFITTPGHTNGSVCIKAENTLFTGDTLFYRSVGNDFPPYGDFEKELSSIKNKLYTIESDCVCLPGHGMSTTLDAERRENPYVRMS